MNFSRKHLNEVKLIIDLIDDKIIEKIVDILLLARKKKGRVFFLGVGGSAGNCTHAVNDFRKIIGLECYAPTDNVSELTARVNDEGWESVFIEWLKISRLKKNDVIFVFSVGGGNLKKKISVNIIKALIFAKKIGSKVVGIIGRKDGYTAKISKACIIIPTINKNSITPHTEAFHSVIWHLIVTHPKLKLNNTKWESISK